MITALISALTAISAQAAAGTPIVGWTHDEVIAALENAGFEHISDTTADPAFPTLNAIAARGVSVSVTRQVCPNGVPAPEDRCAVAAISFVVSALNPHSALAVRNALEHSATSSPGANVLLLDGAGSEGKPQSVVILSHYLASDGGVAPAALDAQISALAGYAADAQEILLATDPSHATFWAEPAD